MSGKKPLRTYRNDTQENMVKSCSAVGCTNRFSKGCSLSFYCFPKDSERLRLWLAAMKRKEWVPNKNSWICSAHFVDGKKSDDPLSPSYVPRIFDFVRSPTKRKASSDVARYDRSLAKRTKDEKANASWSGSVDDLLRESETDEQPESSGEETLMLQHKSRELHEENQKLKDENWRLKESFASLTSDSFSEKSFCADDSKVRFYTGLPSFTTLMAVITHVSANVPPTAGSLSLFTQILLVLIKLRLNLADQDLAYRLGVHQSTISRNFKKWLAIMYERLKPLVAWPDRESLLKTLPMAFRRKFHRCTIIIDCFEIFCERPTNLTARAQTWSNYKHHNTIKYLIGIAPQGVITFISNGWGGRVSDVYLTENCGIVSKLIPGDVILADRGFTVQDTVGMYCAEVKIPAFTRGKKQLSKLEVDTSCQLARLRIHVEHVIGVVRQKYTLLENTLPINMIMCGDGESISTIDKIVTVCCALCNCCESIVSFE